MSPYQMTTEQIISQVTEICRRCNAGHLYLFGSYAVGSQTPTSDMDFYVKGIKNPDDLSRIREETEKIPTLKTIDIFDYDRCRNQYLKEDMDLYGKEIY